MGPKARRQAKFQGAVFTFFLIVSIVTGVWTFAISSAVWTLLFILLAHTSEQKEIALAKQRQVPADEWAEYWKGPQKK